MTSLLYDVGILLGFMVCCISLISFSVSLWIESQKVKGITCAIILGLISLCFPNSLEIFFILMGTVAVICLLFLASRFFANVALESFFYSLIEICFTVGISLFMYDLVNN